MNRQLKKIWICNDVLMDIFPFFERVELGLTLALLSPRFDVLVDAHFNGKTELTIWRAIIQKDTAGPKAKLFVGIDNKSVDFPWPDRPLPNKIRFRFLWIAYIDHSVIGFLRSNKQIFDKGTNLYLHLFSSENNVQPIWDVLVHEIWPIFTTTNVHHLDFDNADHLDPLLRLTSPTILLDLNLSSIQSNRSLFLDALGDDDGPNATPTAGQVLSKWLHMPRKDDQSKGLCCISRLYQQPNLEWINSFKETFRRATSSFSYQINFGLNSSTPIERFELENERTNEKLTMKKHTRYIGHWVMKRCPINGETAAVKWDENLDADLNNVIFMLNIDKNCIGPLSPPAEEKAGPSNEKAFSTTPGPSGSAAE